MADSSGEEDLSAGMGDDFADTDAIAASYDKVAGDYENRFRDELASKPEDRRLLQLVAGTDGLVADIGSGPGHIATFLRSHGASVIAADAAPAMVRRALLAGHPAVTADMRQLPYRKGSLAGVVAFYSVIHLPRPDVGPALSEFGRCLGSGGVLLVSVHAGDGTTGRQEFLGAEVELTATLFGHAEMDDLVVAAGFDVVESFQRRPYGHEGTDRIYVLARRP